jgi:uncharacterized protein YacL
MKSPIRAIRIAFLAFCLGGGYLAFNAATGKLADDSLARYLIIAGLLGLLLILVDMLLKGFSLRSLTSLTLGLGLGALISCFISASPLLDNTTFGGNPEMTSRLFTVRIGIFIASTYLATVITVRSRDEFNLVIPYIRFNPLDTPPNLVVLDTSALIDGRIVGLSDTGFVSAALVLPRFVIEELQAVADSNDLAKRARGRRGLANLNALKAVNGVDLRIHESGMGAQGTVDDRLVALSQSLKAALLTTDYNLAQIARFQGVKWLNLNALAKTMKYEVATGDVVEVELTREGREAGQAVGHLPDGSMIIVTDGAPHLGKTVAAEVTNITPTSAGRMIFSRVRAVV